MKIVVIASNGLNNLCFNGNEEMVPYEVIIGYCIDNVHIPGIDNSTLDSKVFYYGNQGYCHSLL